MLPLLFRLASIDLDLLSSIDTVPTTTVLDYFATLTSTKTSNLQSTYIQFYSCRVILAAQSNQMYRLLCFNRVPRHVGGSFPRVNISSLRSLHSLHLKVNRSVLNSFTMS